MPNAAESPVYEQGDIVRLRSGGPPMSVRLFEAEESVVYVTWFFRGQRGEACYPASLLQPCAPFARHRARPAAEKRSQAIAKSERLTLDAPHAANFRPSHATSE